MTVFAVFAGCFTDEFGLRRPFFLDVIICLVARATMVFTTIPWLALAGGLVSLVIREALGPPGLVAAVRGYFTPPQRAISLSIILMVMEGGFLVACLVFDFVGH